MPPSPEPPNTARGAEVVVITAHPQMEHSRINRRLMHAAQQVPAAAESPRIAVRDLYALYPDYLIDAEAEQTVLAAAQLIVWQHPIHWYSMPALMKLWLDDVFAFGWAYGPGGTALRGKDLWLVATTGGPEASYHPASDNRYFFDAFMPPYEQTANLCGMRFLPPSVLYGAHRATEAEVDAHLAVYVQRLASYPHWPELDELLWGLPPQVPEDVRPDEMEPPAVGVPPSTPRGGAGRLGSGPALGPLLPTPPAVGVPPSTPRGGACRLGSGPALGPLSSPVIGEPPPAPRKNP